MGPRYRTTTRHPQVIRLQNIPHGERRRRLAQGVYQRTTGEGVHTTIKVPIRLTIFLHQEERREITTSTRLPKIKLPDRQKPIPSSPNPRINRPTSKRDTIH